MHEFRVWAPVASRMTVVVDGVRHPMSAQEGGWWRAEAEGRDYGFVVDDGPDLLPDPASRRQPDGVHGLSRVYDQAAFPWSDGAWTGRQLAGAVLYELHIGTFTPGATFDSAVERLAHLVDLGVTHVEVMPVNAVNGMWNWGYDGVLWYAVHEPLGGPDGLKRFVDACHAHGLAVILDVVYNHVGVSGNVLPRFGPYLKDGRNTWGELLNLDGPESETVRRFIADNALMWLRDYHVDGLRLDAVHALSDDSVPHMLEQLAAEVDAMSAHLRRPLTLIAESDLNDPRMISPRHVGGYALDGQWTDDVHHALHSVLTGETHGYYVDFNPISVLAKVLTHAFFHDGTFSEFRRKVHGRPVDRLRTPGYRFVVSLQNHDQVGNRAAGERLPELTSQALLEVGAVLLLTSAFTPMLFMGEEWAASTRWPYFSSHPEPELAAATGKGRIAEFADHGWDVSQMIDPQDPAAYHSAVLNWDEAAKGDHAVMLALYRRLLDLRRAHAELSDPRLDLVCVDYDEDARWVVVHRGSLRVLANLAEHAQPVPVRAHELLLATGIAELGDETVTLSGESAAVVRVRT